MLTWRKSSRSGTNGHSNCVEVATLPIPRIAVRDSKDPDGIKIAIRRDLFAGLIKEIKSGTLDL
jgi:hypothetical protein